eukprot:949284-Prorocentrum_minimum.AAC.2
MSAKYEHQRLPNRTTEVWIRVLNALHDSPSSLDTHSSSNTIWRKKRKARLGRIEFTHDFHLIHPAGGARSGERKLDEGDGGDVATRRAALAEGGGALATRAKAMGGACLNRATGLHSNRRTGHLTVLDAQLGAHGSCPSRGSGNKFAEGNTP